MASWQNNKLINWQAATNGKFFVMAGWFNSKSTRLHCDKKASWENLTYLQVMQVARWKRQVYDDMML
jgi:hypothetical protein